MRLVNIYNEIFTPEYLIKFGYFSYKKNRDIDTWDENYFSTDTFYRMFNLNKYSNVALSIIGSSGKIIDTEPVYFSIPKKGITRRQYKLPNIYSYTLLVKYMCDNKNEFIDVFRKNKFSISKYFDSPKYKYDVTEEIKTKLLFSGNKLLHLDLSNFYHTLYTHSIPWMIMGKGKAKAQRKGGFANELDVLIESCQFGETHGIPTGNLASRIIAELFMCYFDKLMNDKNFKYARYVDDFTFSYTLESEKEEFIEQVNLLCRDFNLYINSEKTKTVDFPQDNNRSKTHIFSFFDEQDFISKSVFQQRLVISNYIDLCVTEESKGNKGALKVIFSGILRNVIYARKFSENEINELFLKKDLRTQTSIFEKILDITIKKPDLTNKFMELFEELFYTKKLKVLAKQVIQKYFEDNNNTLASKILYYHKNNLSQELYQLLLYIVQFDVDTKKILSKKILISLFEERIDDLSLCLLTIIYIKRRFKIDDLLIKISSLLENSSKNYPQQSRFSGRLWFFRYFIYYLIKNNIILSSDVKKILKKLGIKAGKKGYKSELNAKYVLSQGNQLDINKFYEELLNQNISFVDCGQKNNFRYF